LNRTFYPATGTPGNYVVYRAYSTQPTLEYYGTGQSGDWNMIHFYKNKNYTEVRDLILDGRQISPTGFKCYESNHLRFTNNTIKNTTESGIATKYCDYVDSIGNKIYNFGQNAGWSSGISYNSHLWIDNYQGFHSTIRNNIIAGGVDGSTHHTDGNGIILDLSTNSYDPATANTPPVLVANNVVYQNGGRCIIGYIVTNAWVVNNTCYKNGLDLRVENPPNEITANKIKNSYFLNNLTHSWTNGVCYNEFSPSSGNSYRNNLHFACSNSLPNQSAFVQGDPLLENPPTVHPSNNEQWLNLPLTPVQVTNQFKLRSGSPAINAGITPWTIPGIHSAIQSDLQLYLQTDRDGGQRILGGAIDLGAYERQ
jgi:hypothetical protein